MCIVFHDSTILQCATTYIIYIHHLQICDRLKHYL